MSTASSRKDVQDAWAALSSRLHAFSAAAQKVQGSSTFSEQQLQSQRQQLLQWADVLVAAARATTQAICNIQGLTASLIVENKVIHWQWTHSENLSDEVADYRGGW